MSVKTLVFVMRLIALITWLLGSYLWYAEGMRVANWAPVRLLAISLFIFIASQVPVDD